MAHPCNAPHEQESYVQVESRKLAAMCNVVTTSGPAKKAVLKPASVVFCLLMLIFVVVSSEEGQESGHAFERRAGPGSRQWLTPPLANGCRHVYVDMGTNIGHQIRKLYEPSKYPGNPTEPIFQKYFGAERLSVCSFGFEPNPLHQEKLRELEEAYGKLGIRVKLFPLAVSNKAGHATFYTDPKGTATELRASLVKWNVDLGAPVTVQTVDMPAWIRKNVLSRSIPDGPSNAQPPAVVMKSDIENMDELVLTSMFMRGAWCGINAIYGEHASKEWMQAVKLLTKTANCSTEYIPLDDESGDDKLPLPQRLSIERRRLKGLV